MFWETEGTSAELPLSRVTLMTWLRDIASNWPRLSAAPRLVASSVDRDAGACPDWSWRGISRGEREACPG